MSLAAWTAIVGTSIVALTVVVAALGWLLHLSVDKIVAKSVRPIADVLQEVAQDLALGAQSAQHTVETLQDLRGDLDDHIALDEKEHSFLHTQHAETRGTLRALHPDLFR